MKIRTHWYPDCAQRACLRPKSWEVEKENSCNRSKRPIKWNHPHALDSHMGCIFDGRGPEWLSLLSENSPRAQIGLAMCQQPRWWKPNKAKSESFWSKVDLARILSIDEVIMAIPEGITKKEWIKFYTNTIQKFKPDVHVLLNPSAFEWEEMNAVTKDHDTLPMPMMDRLILRFFHERKSKKTLSKKNNHQLIPGEKSGQIFQASKTIMSKILTAFPLMRSNFFCSRSQNLHTMIDSGPLRTPSNLR